MLIDDDSNLNFSGAVIRLTRGSYVFASVGAVLRSTMAFCIIEVVN